MTSQVLAILPGLMCNSIMFEDQLEAFPGAVIVDDFYGGADRLKTMADHALAFLPERFALLGHSLGARIALEVYRKAPDRVSRLALADTGVHPVEPGEQEKRYALRDLGRDKGFDALVDAWLPPMLSAAAREDSDLVARLRGMCISAGQARFEAQTEALLHRRPVDAVLRSICCPTLVVVGEADIWSPVAQHKAIAASIPEARMCVVPKAGHMLPAEAPSAFNEILADWLHW